MAISPTARGLILCEAVTVDPVTQNLTLIKCFRTIRADRFPAACKPFSVTANLVNGLGDVILRLVITQLNDNEVVHSLAKHVRFQDRLQDVKMKLEVRRFVAHTAGRFGVELWANDDLIAQTDFRVLEKET